MRRSTVMPPNWIIAISILSSMSMVSPAFVYATDGNESNIVTGSQSSNTNNFQDTSNTQVSSNNTSHTNNADALYVNTGQNTASGNTVGGKTSTGSITANLQSHTTLAEDNGFNLNNNDNSSPTSVTTQNNETGANSSNTNRTSINHAVGIAENNNADITNYADIQANTGNNTTTYNTVTGAMSTGNISIGVEIGNTNANPSPSPSGTPEVPNSPSSGGEGGGSPLNPGSNPSSNPENPSFLSVPISAASSGGMGGGFFPAGANMLTPLISLVLIGIFTGTHILLRRRFV